MSVSVIEPISVASVSSSRSAGSKPWIGVPDQMADATEHVVEQSPRVAEQHQLPDQAAHEPFEIGVGIWAGRRRDQPPGEQQHSKIERGTGDPMHDRHHHRQHRLVDLQVRRKRARPLCSRCRSCLKLGHCWSPENLAARLA